MNELKQIIIEEIRANGPMPLEDYMARALGITRTVITQKKIHSAKKEILSLHLKPVRFSAS